MAGFGGELYPQVGDVGIETRKLVTQIYRSSMRLELEHIKAETEAIKTKAHADDDDAILELARSGAEKKRRDKQKVQRLARAEIN